MRLCYQQGLPRLFFLMFFLLKTCSSRSSKCEKNGVGYSICCETCKLAGKTTIYSGETGKNGFTRGKQHQDALRLKDEENALWKHCMVDHGGKIAKFSMKILGVFHSCLSRQVNEAVRIEISTADCIMNSKAEWHQAPLVRVVPVTGLQEEQVAGGDPRQEGGGRGRGRGTRGRGGGGARRRVVPVVGPQEEQVAGVDPQQVDGGRGRERVTRGRRGGGARKRGRGQ